MRLFKSKKAHHLTLKKLRQENKESLIGGAIIIIFNCLSFGLRDFIPDITTLGLALIPVSLIWIGLMIVSASHYFNRINLEALCQINNIPITDVCQCKPCRIERGQS